MFATSILSDQLRNNGKSSNLRGCPRNRVKRNQYPQNQTASTVATRSGPSEHPDYRNRGQHRHELQSNHRAERIEGGDEGAGNEEYSINHAEQDDEAGC